MKFTKEQIMKAVKCKSVDELMALARTEGIELAKEEAEKYFAQISGSSLNLDEIAAVAGGCTGNICGANVSAAC